MISLSQLRGNCTICLNKIEELPPNIAKYFSLIKIENLHLEGIKKLSPLASKYLSSSHTRRLYLGLTEMDNEVRENLSRYQGIRIIINGKSFFDRGKIYELCPLQR
jgi:hypothetical protein